MSKLAEEVTSVILGEIRCDTNDVCPRRSLTGFHTSIDDLRRTIPKHHPEWMVGLCDWCNRYYIFQWPTK